jgi:hypothetical protein
MCHVWGIGEIIQGFVGMPEVNSPLLRPRCREKYNIKLDPQQVGCRSTDHIDPDQDMYR